MDLSALRGAKEKAQVKRVEKTEEYDKTYAQALELFELFDDNLDENTLKQAGKKFAEAASYCKDKAEPYYFLSYIYYLFKHDDLAIEYYETAKSIAPELNGLNELEMLLFRDTI